MIHYDPATAVEMRKNLADNYTALKARLPHGRGSMNLVDYLHSEVGLPMGSILPPMADSRHCGWTTDQAKADAAREAGATVTTCPAGSSGGVTGWEVTCSQGAEK